MANNNGYPFRTQKDIVAQLATDTAFQYECLSILVGRQTSDEVEEKVTKYTNKRGLRCSESVWMPTLDQKIRNGEQLTPEESARLDATLPIYRKQLAAHFRAVALATNPELAEKAKTFGV